jgi:hypothetical protein
VLLLLLLLLLPVLLLLRLLRLLLRLARGKTPGVCLTSCAWLGGGARQLACRCTSVDGAGRSGGAQRNVVNVDVAGISSGPWASSLSTTGRRIVRDKIHQEAKRVAIRSTQLMSACRVPSAQKEQRLAGAPRARARPRWANAPGRGGCVCVCGGGGLLHLLPRGFQSYNFMTSPPTALSPLGLGPACLVPAVHILTQLGGDAAS